VNRRAIIVGCMAMLCVPTATAGERSPGDDLKNDGNRLGRQRARRRERRDWKRQWQYTRPYRFYDEAPFFPSFPRRRYVDPWAAYDRCVWKYGDPYACERFVWRGW
jgi:hypothetical protein